MQQDLAFVFPGQGSQSVGMLADLGENDIVNQTFNEASAALGYDLWQLVSQGPAEKLNQTNFTQPALLTASVAMYRLWLASNGAAPAVLAGHSLGEYSALVCAEVLSLADAVKLVEKRGQFMQTAVPEGVGAMAAVIGLDDAAIIAACEQSAGDEVVSAVNFNSPGQVVIAGHAAAVERAGLACKAAGAKRVLPLPVSVPSHCALMQPAAERLATEMDAISFNTPTVKVINNVDVAAETDIVAIKAALVRQLFSPVRWTETIELLGQSGVTRIIEAGPGKVLQGLIKRINKDIDCQSINDSASIADAIAK